MAETTGISWCDGTFNPWIGCFKVSPACKFCYAETQNQYRKWSQWGPASTTHRKVTSEANWKKPLTWNRKAEKEGTRLKVFCASLADVFEEHSDVVDARQRLWTLIEATPNLDWLLLTKRPQNVARMVPARWMENGFPKQVWLGTSVENQKYANERIPELLQYRYAVEVLFLSYEPALGPVDLIRQEWWDYRYMYDFYPEGWFPKPIDWVICGGESGPKHRPMNPWWARYMQKQCESANVAFWFKQWGGLTSKSGGDLLDGQQYHQFPTHCLQPTRP